MLRVEPLAATTPADARAGTSGSAAPRSESARRLLPRIDADLGLRREHHGLHRDRVRDAPGCRRAARARASGTAHEVARYGEHEVGVRAVHARQEPLDRLHRDLGPALHELGTPSPSYCCRRKASGFSWRKPLGCASHGRDDALGRALEQVPDERTADAEAEHHEFVYTQVIHDAEVVVGERVPRPVGLERPRTRRRSRCASRR